MAKVNLYTSRCIISKNLKFSLTYLSFAAPEFHNIGINSCKLFIVYGFLYYKHILPINSYILCHKFLLQVVARHHLVGRSFAILFVSPCSLFSHVCKRLSGRNYKGFIGAANI